MAVFSIPWWPQYACTCARMVAPCVAGAALAPPPPRLCTLL